MPASSKIIVNTGNVLNLIEIKQKAGQNVTEELVESLQITVADWEKNKTAGIAVTQNGTVGEGVKAGAGRVVMSRRQDDLLAKMAEEDRKNLKIGVKVFVEDDSIASLVDCLENVYETLDIEAIDNLVLAYNPAARTEGVGSDLTNGDAQTTCDRILPRLKVLWSTLEEKYVKTGRILQLGVADIEEACFKNLHSWSSVQPTIVQINLSSCCVVPPGLQAFCKENDVQLLTHSDPQEIISSKVLGGILGANVEFIDWCVRFQVHIRCRGVLSLKGYITCATVDQL